MAGSEVKIKRRGLSVCLLAVVSFGCLAVALWSGSWLAAAATGAPWGVFGPPTRLFLPIVARGVTDLPALPDLVVSSVRFNMRGYQGGCVSEYGAIVVVACVANQGQGDAGQFGLSVNGVEAAAAPGLVAYEHVCLETTAAYSSGPVTVVVDPANKVAESDESNNTWAGRLPVPTAPVLCTATPTPTPSSTPSISMRLQR